MKKLFIAALLVATSAISISASAATLSLDGSLATGTLGNKTYSSVFTGLSALTGDYTVNSLSFKFSFMDDSDWGIKTGHGYTETAGAYSKKNGIYYRDAAGVKSVFYSTDVESAKLMFGTDLLGTGSTKNQTTAVTTGVGTGLRIDDLDCSWHGCTLYKSNLTTTKQNVFNNTGGFVIEDTISTGAIIDALLRDGQLMLGLKIGGDLVLTGAELLVNYTMNETSGENPAEVPEPSSILLAGAGLAAIGFARRRRAAKA